MSERLLTVSDSLQFLAVSAEEAAQARAERMYLEQYRKTKKAILMKENASLPLGAQEREAYADPEYLKVLEGLKAAVFADAKMQFMREAASAKIEAWRTQEATKRSGKI